MSSDQAVAGRASAEGTSRFAQRFERLPGHFRRPDRLWLSSLGMGTRGGDPGGADDLGYRSSALHALELGCNVFDTAPFYRHQTSERALGAALLRGFGQGLARRDEVFVVSKCGYLSLDLDHPLAARGARPYLLETYIESGLLDPADLVDGAHAITPAFVRDQIRRSRHNLGLETLDLYCLEEPEVQLLEWGPTEFRVRLARAFEALEQAVADGEIGAYGISSWSGLLLPHTERGHLSLVDLFDVALEVGGPDHHLRAVILPYGPALPEALAAEAQFGPEMRTGAALEALKDTGTAVLACAPLARGRALGRLPAPVARRLGEDLTDAQRCLQFARSSAGVDCALVGMRRPEHAAENLALAEVAPVSEAEIASLFAAATA